MATAENKPCIYDPAVYFGHREMDLGMSKLFGGFDNLFYQNYNEHYPLEKNWQKRSDICNLYPLMVHVNLFGGGYISQVEAILRPF
jgi:protein-ribulosamine 3-kinase